MSYALTPTLSVAAAHVRTRLLADGTLTATLRGAPLWAVLEPRALAAAGAHNAQVWCGTVGPCFEKGLAATPDPGFADRFRLCMMKGSRSASAEGSFQRGLGRAAKQRIACLLKVLRSAAPVDPDAETLWRLIQSDFYDNQRVIVDSPHATSPAAWPGHCSRHRRAVLADR